MGEPIVRTATKMQPGTETQAGKTGHHLSKKKYNSRIRSSVKSSAPGKAAMSRRCMRRHQPEGMLTI
jgi:hypothetical protein